MPEGVPFFRRRVGGESSQSLVNGGKMIRTENISESEEQRMNKKIFKRAVAMMMAAVLTVGAALPSSNVFASGSDEEKDTKTLAEYLVANNVTIMKAFFQSVGALVGLIAEGDRIELKVATEQADVIKNLGFGESLIMLILASLLSIIVIICGFFLIYTVYFRFLKLLVIVPLGSIAFSTMSGNRVVAHTCATYCKYFLSVCFEAVTMALAIVVCNAFINAGLPSFAGDYADWTKTLIYLCEMTFTVALTVGSVKGAQSLTSKALGL